MDTEEGKRAKRFVEARLKGCEFIIVKTYKDRTDKFDRYLADIFYSPGASDPALVAQEGPILIRNFWTNTWPCHINSRNIYD